MEIENKLLKFRQESAQKQKEQETTEKRRPALAERAKTYFDKFWSYGIRDDQPPPGDDQLRHRKKVARKLVTEAREEEEEVEEEEEEPADFKLQMTKLVLQAVLWLSLFVLFVKLEFGAVYFVLSSLVIIYLNTGKRKSSSLSAYSVFNPNVERIHGTITPEQLQSSLLGGL